MRPVRITGITGVSPWVPLDTYSPAKASVQSNQATLAIEITMSNVFDTSVAPLATASALVAGVLELPAGTRAVRGTGLVPADVMNVSQQGLL